MASPQNSWGYPQAQTPTQPKPLQTGMAGGGAPSTPSQYPWQYRGIGSGEAQILQGQLEQAGLWKPEYDTWSNVDPENGVQGTADYSALGPYQYGEMKGEGTDIHRGLFGPGGQYLSGYTDQFHDSMTGSDWWDAATAVVAPIAAGYGAQYLAGEGAAGATAGAAGDGTFTTQLAGYESPFSAMNASGAVETGAGAVSGGTGMSAAPGTWGTTTTAGAGTAAPAATGWEGLASFAGKNPQLLAGLVGGGISALQGSPDMPSGGSGGNNTAQIDALKSYLYGGMAGGTGGTPDFSGLPGVPTGDPQQFYQNAADAMYSQQTRYLDPQMQQQQQALEARLSEQGFVPGTPGYKQAMQNFQDTSARAYGAARDSSIAQGVTAGQGTFNNTMAASREALAQYLAKRNQPLNEINALQTGDQIQYGQGLDRYNAEIGSQNSQNQMLGQLATALGIYYSDARLKEDITPIGQTPGGANLYTYTIFGRRETGVLAQELAQTQPDAVMLDPESGFLMVDYRKVR